jgi:hypothetical protein
VRRVAELGSLGHMRIIVLLLASAGVTLLGADAFRSYLKASGGPPMSGPEEKLLLITNNITLGRIVAVLGPGWKSPGDDDNSGAIQWQFPNGRYLYVWPSRYEADEVISTNRDALARMWVSRESRPAIRL